MLARQALTPAAVVDHFPDISLAEARKLVSAVHRGTELDARTFLPHVRRGAITAFARATSMPGLRALAEAHSQIDPFRKYAFEIDGGHVIETVRIPLEKPGRFSVCVSSQAGCALACSFCATGRLGLQRNLETWEIVEQVRHVSKGLAHVRRERVHGVVFQGMGEPMANLDRVLETIRVLCDPCALAIDARNITVCTSGVPSGIRRLASEAPRVRLGLSLGAADAETRRSLMPIERANPLAVVLDAVAEHATVTGLAPMWAITLLAGLNDTDEHARAFARLHREFAARTGTRPRVSVIPYNPLGGADDPYQRSSDAVFVRFCDVMRAEGVATHRRYSGGGDVAAACGQLAGASLPVHGAGTPEPLPSSPGAASSAQSN